MAARPNTEDEQMASYRIIMWDTASITKLNETVRSRRSAAFDKAWDFARARLQAFAKLDTKSAWDVRTKINLACDIMQVGEERCFEISNTGASVIIVREA